MTIYTHADLDREAKIAVRDVRKTTGDYLSKLQGWSILVNGENTCLRVDILTGPWSKSRRGSLIQRYVAI